MSYAGTIFEAMRKVRAAVGMAAKDFDILLTPSLPGTARPHGEYSTTREDLSAEEYMKGDIRLFQYLGVFNVTGSHRYRCHWPIAPTACPSAYNWPPASATRPHW